MSAITAVASLLLGIFVREFLRFWDVRRQRKSAAGMMLCELLQMRHVLLGTRAIIDVLRKIPDVPADGPFRARQLITQLTSEGSRSNDRYEKALDVLAQADPVLAFRMKSQNTLVQYFDRLSALVSTGSQDAALFVELEKKLEDLALPPLEETIAELATIHSHFTRRRVTRLLAKASTMPEQYQIFVNDLIVKASPTNRPA